MPPHLRSGFLESAPQKKYRSGYYIFFDEKKQHHLGQAIGQLNNIIGMEYEMLNDNQRQHYEDLYEKYNNEFKESLLVFYGATKKELRIAKAGEDSIPDKPKRPTAPVLRYQNEVISKMGTENPDLEDSAIHKLIVKNYRELSASDKEPYEKEYEKDYVEFKKKLETWNEQYSQKDDAHKKFMEEKHKRAAVKKGSDDDFVYQEFVRQKKTMKMNPEIKPFVQVEHKEKGKNTSSVDSKYKNLQHTTLQQDESTNPVDKPIPKQRGRKPNAQI